MNRLIILTIAVLASAACRKFNTFSGSDAANAFLPPPSELNISYAVTGPLQFSGNIESVWCNDTLTISSSNGKNSVRIWLLAPTLQDTTYQVDGRNGGIELYDQRGNMVGFSAGNLIFTVYCHSGHTINGNLSCFLNNYFATPEYASATGNFNNLSVYVLPE